MSSGHQVAPGRKQLAEFDENRPQRLQRQTQTFGARRLDRSPEQRQLDQRAQDAEAFVAEEELLQAKAEDHMQNFDQAQ